MLNNEAINVALGLIFVFLLYSLLASILMESVARKMGLRARMLLKAISKILDDSDFKNDNYVSRAFYSLSESKYMNPFKERSFTALFYSHPNIINLGRNSFSSKPAYISDELFAETVIQILRGNEFKGQQNQVELIKANLTDFQNGYGKIPAPAYYKKKTLSKESYTLVKAEDEISIDENCYIKIHPHTYYQFKQALFDSHQDIDWFKSKLKSWFNETVDRAEGWYVRQTRTFLFLIGFILAIIFNVDCIDIGKRLSGDKELRNKVVEMATAFSQSHDPDTRDASTKALTNAIKDVNNVNNVLSGSVRTGDATNIGGWLLTAIAISLGASFWFDLLKKIMAIRTAGEKPAETITKNEAITQDAIG